MKFTVFWIEKMGRIFTGVTVRSIWQYYSRPISMALFFIQNCLLLKGFLECFNYLKMLEKNL